LEWHKQFKYDPIKSLIESNDPAVFYFTRRDLLRGNVEPISVLWSLPAAQRIINKQQPVGHWIYPGKNEDYFLLATFQNLQTLVYQYGFDKTHPAMYNACEYLFSHQTEEGDIRGFIGNQYAPYYTGIVLAL
jgi:hypothetical protein